MMCWIVTTRSEMYCNMQQIYDWFPGAIAIVTHKYKVFPEM